MARGALRTRLEQLKDLALWEWDEEEDLEVLHEGLRCEDPEIRRLAAECAGEHPYPPTVGELLRLLREDDVPEVRAAAAIALGPALEMADIDPEDVFEDDPAAGERFLAEAMETLRSLHQDAAQPKIVRRRALEAAVRADADWLTPAVRWAYASDDREWRITAVFCMGFVSGFEREILEALGSEDDELRAEAAAAAGRASLKRAVRRLAALAADPEEPRDVRFAAVEGLGSMGLPQAVEALDRLAFAVRDRELLEAIEEASIEAAALSWLPPDEW